MTTARPAAVLAVTGARAGQLTWVNLGGHAVERGSGVLVREGADAWLGRVLVLPAQIVEPVTLAGLPTVERLAGEDDPWPEPPAWAGRALLDALALPADLAAPTGR